jgi:hypothetical protein
LQNLLSISDTSTVDSGSTGGGVFGKKISVRGECPASHPNLPLGLPNYCLPRAPTCLLEALSPGQIGKHCFAKIFVILFVFIPMFRYVILSYPANGERVFHQMFLNLVGNIFAFRVANFVSSIKANVSRCGRQGNI